MQRLAEGQSFGSAFLTFAVEQVISPIDLAREVGILRITRRGRWMVNRLDLLDWPRMCDYESLARMMGIDADDLKMTTMWRFDGLPGAREGVHGADLWWRTRRPGTFWYIRERDRYCPLCLQEQQYFRLAWRLRPLTACTRHKLTLVEGCHVCRQPSPLGSYLTHREPLIQPTIPKAGKGLDGISWPSGADVQCHCGECGADLRLAAKEILLSPAPERFSVLEDALGFGAPKTTVTIDRPVLDLFYHLARLLIGTARRGYGDAACVALFENGKPQFLGSSGDGIPADLVQMHVLADATLRLLQGWPSSFHRLHAEMQEHSDVGLFGVGDRLALPTSLVAEIRRNTGRSTRALLEVQVAPFALGEDSLGPLAPAEWARVLSVLWTTDGPPPLLLQPKATSEQKFVFGRGDQVRNVCDALLAAVETDGSVPRQGIADHVFERFTDRWAQGPQFYELLCCIQQVARSRRRPAQSNSIFVDPKYPELGISDAAWLAVRPLLPSFSLVDRLGRKAGRPVNLRELLGFTLTHLCGDVNAKPPRIDERLNATPRPVWVAVRALCAAELDHDAPSSMISRPIISDAMWEAADVARLLGPQAAHGRRANVTYRQAIETVVDSWLTSETIAATEAMRRTGVRHRTGPMTTWVLGWWHDGLLKTALSRLERTADDELRRSCFAYVARAATPPRLGVSGATTSAKGSSLDGLPDRKNSNRAQTEAFGGLDV